MVRLKVYDGALKIREAELGTQILTLGREEGNTIVLADASVSRRHAAIEPVANFFLVRDLGSTNGTFVNEMLVRSQVLSDGDVLRLGKYLLRVDAQAGKRQDSTRVRVEKLNVAGVPAGSRPPTGAGAGPPAAPGREELAKLVEIQSQIGLLDDADSLLDHVLEILLRKLGAQRGSVLLHAGEPVELPAAGFVPATARSSDDCRQPAAELVIAEDVLLQAADSRDGVLVAPTTEAPQSVIAAMLAHGGRRRGVIYLEREPDRPPFSPEDLGLLAAAARFAAISLLNCELYAAAARSREVLEAVFTQETDGLVVTDPEFTVVEANRAARFCLDLRDANPLGCSFFGLCSKFALQPAEDLIRCGASRGSASFTLHHAGGDRLPLLATLTAYPASRREPLGFLVRVREAAVGAGAPPAQVPALEATVQ